MSNEGCNIAAMYWQALAQPPEASAHALPEALDVLQRT